jgi:putative tricarboxylic transport membrane protein
MNKDLVSGIALVAIAAGYYLASRSILVSSLEDDFGPHGLPNILAIALGAIGVVLIARGAWAARKPRPANSTPAETWRPLRALGLVALGFGYILIVSRLGYVLSIALLLTVVPWYEGIKPTWRLPAIAIGGAVVLWLLFVQLLDVVQPTGLFF